MSNKREATPMEKSVPHNYEAEAAVLGSLLIDPDIIPEIREIIVAAEFHKDAHRIIYETILAVDNNQEAPDFLTVGDELERQGKTEEAGGEGYLIELINCIPTSANAVQYANRVHQTYIARRLLRAAAEIAQMAYEVDPQMLEKSESMIYHLAHTTRKNKLVVRSMNEVMSSTVTYVMEASENGGQFTGIPSGFLDLDKAIQGFDRGQLVVIAGRPAMGKSAFGLNLAENAAKAGKKGIVFSIEMTEIEIGLRSLSGASEIVNTRLKSGDIYDDEWTPLLEKSTELSQLPLYIGDTPDITVDSIKSAIRQHVMQHGPLDFILVDYLQLMGVAESGRQKNRAEEVSELARGLKLAAKEFGITVFALAQVSRAAEGRRPTMADLKESGGIEENANIIICLYRDEVYNPETEDKNIAEAIIVKNRGGNTGTVRLFYNGPLTRFGNLEQYLSA